MDGVLRIYSTENLIRPAVKVKIGVDSLTSIKGNGAASFDFKNGFNVKNLNIQLEGASKIDLNINSAQKLVINISGASQLEAEGVADTLMISGRGASKIEADDLRSNVVKVDLSGASKAEIYASDEFDGKASGASKIVCFGNPFKRSNDSHEGSAIRYE